MRSEMLSKAVDEIEGFVFYNSPLDVLAGVYRALTKYVLMMCGTESSFSFDATFGLFVFCFIVSEALKPSAMFEYLPETELSGQMQYAKATIIAVERHLITIAETVKENSE